MPFIYLFILQISIDHLLCTRNYFRRRRFSSEHEIGLALIFYIYLKETDQTPKNPMLWRKMKWIKGMRVFAKMICELAGLVHSYNPSMQEVEAEDKEFKTSLLGYLTSLKTAWVT